jgi:DNA-binding beta-propeller fold protein YncE
VSDAWGRAGTALLVLVAGWGVFLASGATAAVLEFERQWEHPGPDGVGVSKRGYVYVTDGDRITRYNRKGRTLGRWGRPGEGPGELGDAKGLAVHSDGKVLVADYANDRVQVFRPRGGFVRTFGLPGGVEWGPWDLDVAADGTVFVLDVRNDLVHRFSLMGAYGGAIGGTGSAGGELDSPCGIAADRRGGIYVTGTGDDRVQVFARSGAFVTSWGGFTNPCGIAVDRRGIVFVGDTPAKAPRIQQFKANGRRAGRAITSFGRRDAFNAGPGLDLDFQGNLYAAEKAIGEQRIVKFRRR